MTPDNSDHLGGEGHAIEDIDWINFVRACRLAEMKRVPTVLFTGKGEPTLYADELEAYFEAMKEFRFPFVDLQTNGIILDKARREVPGCEINTARLHQWREHVSTIAISIVHYDSIGNREIYTPGRDEPVDLDLLVAYLRKIGFSVRLCCTLVKGYIEDWNDVASLIEYAKLHDVQQLTIRPVSKPVETRNREVYNWVSEHQVTEEQQAGIADYIERQGNYLRSLAHGAPIYDVHGQNVCIADCLMTDREPGDALQIIFWPDGRIRHDWQFEGAVLL
jgi:pyruvate-formate lyase-activating enzyme